MGVSEELKRPGKNKVTGDDIANGAIGLRHLDPALFSEFRQIALHSHTGVKSRRVLMQDLDGYFPKGGFYMYDTAGTRYKVTITGGAFVLTAV